jgi:hypothetical protein
MGRKFGDDGEWLCRWGDMEVCGFAVTFQQFSDLEIAAPSGFADKKFPFQSVSFFATGRGGGFFAAPLFARLPRRGRERGMAGLAAAPAKLVTRTCTT